MRKTSGVNAHSMYGLCNVIPSLATVLPFAPTPRQTGALPPKRKKKNSRLLPSGKLAPARIEDRTFCQQPRA